ncbi:MAG: hypothetical protein H6Q00_575 [Holophagaceae bacterium]|nr:hypothetical protein [Holophagaceae bacterium]
MSTRNKMENVENLDRPKSTSPSAPVNANAENKGKNNMTRSECRM